MKLKKTSKHSLSILLIKPNKLDLGGLQKYLSCGDTLVTTVDSASAESDASLQTYYDLILIASNMSDLDFWLITNVKHFCDGVVTVIALTPAIRKSDLCDLVLESHSELRFFLDTICYLSTPGKSLQIRSKKLTRAEAILFSQIQPDKDEVR